MSLDSETPESAAAQMAEAKAQIAALSSEVAALRGLVNTVRDGARADREDAFAIRRQIDELTKEHAIVRDASRRSFASLYEHLARLIRDGEVSDERINSLEVGLYPKVREIRARLDEILGDANPGGESEKLDRRS